MRPGMRGSPVTSTSQKMNPPLKTANRVFSRGYVRTYGPGSSTWTCPATGSYRFILGGGGGGSESGAGLGGGGGSQAIKVKRVSAGETVAFSVASTISVNVAGGDTTATFNDGTVVTAGGGQRSQDGGAGGTATGGDINTSGSSRSGATGGAGATSGLYGLPGGKGAEGAGGGVQGGVSSIGNVVIMLESP